MTAPATRVQSEETARQVIPLSLSGEEEVKAFSSPNLAAPLTHRVEQEQEEESGARAAAEEGNSTSGTKPLCTSPRVTNAGVARDQGHASLNRLLRILENLWYRGSSNTPARG